MPDIQKTRKIRKVRIGESVYDRICCGGQGDWCEGKSCGDCGALPGQPHLWGCDLERCPVCGGQLISCSCRDVFLTEDGKEGK